MPQKPMKNKAKSPGKVGLFLNTLHFCKDYWLFLAPAIGFVACMVALPNRVAAVEKKTDKLEEVISEQKKTREMMQKSPPGFQWNETVQDYIAWPDDPRLKKKGR